jgi:glucosyl-3-phosphoglycerate phosphatase
MTDRNSRAPLAAPLTKRWFVLRHGQSEANVACIVASQLTNAETAYGLTEVGREEVGNSVRRARDEILEGSPLHIVMSPFLRTRETAGIAGQILGTSPDADHRLVERNFGDYELLSDEHYKEVWAVDPTDPDNVPGHAESVYRVTERVCDLVLEAENNPDITTCLIVTHCDVAMILTCAFQNLDPRHHRSLDPIETGELRRLQQP